MSEKKIRTSGHFVNVLDASKQQLVILDAISQLSPLDFDTFVFIGLSGAVVAPILSYEMGKEMLMIRKHGGQDRSNSGTWIEGHHTAKRVVVVDDLISSGKTMSQVMCAIRELQRTDSPDIKIVGLLLTMTHLSGNSWEYVPKLYSPQDSFFRKMIQSEYQFPHPKTGETIATFVDDKPLS